MTGFRWNDWNLENATKHGCRVAEIEAAVRRGLRERRSRECGGKKFRIEERGIGDRVIEVIFIFDDSETTMVYVIHAMPLTTRRRRSF